jgi:hypothetical protein
MFSNPLSGLRFGGETLDYFRLTIRPKNVYHPAESGVFSRHENGSVFGHLPNMLLRRAPDQVWNSAALSIAFGVDAPIFFEFEGPMNKFPFQPYLPSGSQ